MHQELQDRGGRTALLVIDVQIAVVKDGFDSDVVVNRIGKVIEAAREASVPVVYVQHEVPGYPPMACGGDGWQIRSEVAPVDGEPVLAKRYPDSFVDTTLTETLESLGVGSLIVAGAQSDCCIRATSQGALSRGYDVTLVSDAHTTSDQEFDGVTIPAETSVALINASLPWLLYPNATSAVASYDEVIAGFGKE
jgi:nicotinamidase-related amidase